jgi:hypothetical protein
MGTSKEKTDKNLRVVEPVQRRDRSQNRGRKEETTHYPVDPVEEVSEENKSTMQLHA